MSDRLILNLPGIGPGIIIPAVEHDWSDCFKVNKYGRNPAISAGTVEDIWSYGGTRTYMSGNVALFASSSDDNDTVDITVQGLDASGDRQEQTIALTGETKVEIAGVTWSHVFRAWNSDSANLVGDVYIFEDDDLTDGVPDTATKVRAKVDLAKQQTHMAFYTIPSGYTGYLLGWYGTLNRGNTAGAADIELFARANGGVFRSKDIRGVMGAGNSSFIHNYPIFPDYSELTDLKILANVTGNGNDISAGFSLLCVKNKAT